MVVANCFSLAPLLFFSRALLPLALSSARALVIPLYKTVYSIRSCRRTLAKTRKSLGINAPIINWTFATLIFGFSQVGANTFFLLWGVTGIFFLGDAPATITRPAPRMITKLKILKWNFQKFQHFSSSKNPFFSKENFEKLIILQKF